MGEHTQKEWLIQKHNVEKNSFKDIATMQSVSIDTITYWARKLGVKNNNNRKKRQPKINNKEAKGGDGKIACVCQFCGHKKYMTKRNPTMREVAKWLKNFQCPICHRRRKI